MSLQSSNQDLSLEDEKAKKEDRPFPSHLSIRSGTIQTKKNLAMTSQNREKYTFTVSGKYSGRRLLGQFQDRITVLADKISCRNCFQLCASRLHLQSDNPTGNPELPGVRKLKRSTESLVEKEEPEFNVDLRIEGSAQIVFLKDEERMGQIQEAVENFRNGSRTESVLEDLGKPENSLNLSEESSRTMHEFMLEAHTGGIDLLFLWRLSST